MCRDWFEGGLLHATNSATLAYNLSYPSLCHLAWSSDSVWCLWACPFLLATASANSCTVPLSSLIIWSFPFISLSSWTIHLDSYLPLGEKSVSCSSACRSTTSCWLGHWSIWSPGHPKASALTSCLRKYPGLLVQNSQAWSPGQSYWPWSLWAGLPAPSDSSCSGCRMQPEPPCRPYKLCTWRGHPSQNVPETHGYTSCGTSSLVLSHVLNS